MGVSIVKLNSRAGQFEINSKMKPFILTLLLIAVVLSVVVQGGYVRKSGCKKTRGSLILCDEIECKYGDDVVIKDPRCQYCRCRSAPRTRRDVGSELKKKKRKPKKGKDGKTKKKKPNNGKAKCLRKVRNAFLCRGKNKCKYGRFLRFRTQEGRCPYCSCRVGPK